MSKIILPTTQDAPTPIMFHLSQSTPILDYQSVLIQYIFVWSISASQFLSDPIIPTHSYLFGLSLPANSCLVGLFRLTHICSVYLCQPILVWLDYSDSLIFVRSISASQFLSGWIIPTHSYLSGLSLPANSCPIQLFRLTHICSVYLCQPILVWLDYSDSLIFVRSISASQFLSGWIIPTHSYLFGLSLPANSCLVGLFRLTHICSVYLCQPILVRSNYSDSLIFVRSISASQFLSDPIIPTHSYLFGLSLPANSCPIQLFRLTHICSVYVRNPLFPSCVPDIIVTCI
jgi:dimeric dUTPase (all-alpha-NTP-PPase superfamily)